jgi:hypothetical protein
MRSTGSGFLFLLVLLILGNIYGYSSPSYSDEDLEEMEFSIECDSESSDPDQLDQDNSSEPPENEEKLNGQNDFSPPFSYSQIYHSAIKSINSSHNVLHKKNNRHTDESPSSSDTEEEERSIPIYVLPVVSEKSDLGEKPGTINFGRFSGKVYFPDRKKYNKLAKDEINVKFCAANYTNDEDITDIDVQTKIDSQNPVFSSDTKIVKEEKEIGGEDTPSPSGPPPIIEIGIVEPHAYQVAKIEKNDNSEYFDLNPRNAKEAEDLKEKIVGDTPAPPGAPITIEIELVEPYTHQIAKIEKNDYSEYFDLNPRNAKEAGDLNEKVEIATGRDIREVKRQNMNPKERLDTNSKEARYVQENFIQTCGYPSRSYPSKNPIFPDFNVNPTGPKYMKTIVHINFTVYNREKEEGSITKRQDYFEDSPDINIANGNGAINGKKGKWNNDNDFPAIALYFFIALCISIVIAGLFAIMKLRRTFIVASTQFPPPPLPTSMADVLLSSDHNQVLPDEDLI